MPWQDTSSLALALQASAHTWLPLSTALTSAPLVVFQNLRARRASVKEVQQASAGSMHHPAVVLPSRLHGHWCGPRPDAVLHGSACRERANSLRAAQWQGRE